MKPIVVLGATGYTGQLVARSVAAAGAPLRVAGRRPDAVASLAARLGAEGVVADVADPASLDAALQGAGALVTTVGPFLELGDAAVDAALRNAVPYVDTTAEQPFVERLRRRHGEAEEAGIAMLPGHGADFAFSQCGAAILADHLGPLRSCEAFHELGDFRPGRGTARSMVGLLGEPVFGWRRGGRAPVADRWSRRTLRLPSGMASVAPFAGGDVALLSAEWPHLQTASANLVLSPAEARGVALAGKLMPALGALTPAALRRWLQRFVERRVDDPSEAERAATPWAVHVRGAGEGAGWCSMAGRSTYDDSGHVAAQAGIWLADGRARRAGVLPTGEAFPAGEFLDGLAEHGVTWSSSVDRVWAEVGEPTEVRTVAEVAASPEQVWALLSPDVHWGAWNSVFTGFTGDTRPGGRGELGFQAGARAITVAVDFDVVEPGRELAWYGGPAGVFRGRHGFLLEPISDGELAGGTRITHHELFGGVVPRLLGARLRAMVEPTYLSVTEELVAALDAAG